VIILDDQMLDDKCRWMRGGLLEYVAVSELQGKGTTAVIPSMFREGVQCLLGHIPSPS